MPQNNKSLSHDISNLCLYFFSLGNVPNQFLELRITYYDVLSRIDLMSSLKKGWRPRRTIVFASWGAGEHGYMGSLEWIERVANVFMIFHPGFINSGPIL